MRERSNNDRVRTIMSKQLLFTTLLSLILVAPHSASNATAETIDFEGFAAGTIVSFVTGDAGSGPILVNGVNPDLPGNNTAMIFDSSCPGGCSGGDPDLGSPHIKFGGPGRGSGGLPGSPFANVSGLPICHPKNPSRRCPLSFRR